MRKVHYITGGPWAIYLSMLGSGMCIKCKGIKKLTMIYNNLNNKPIYSENWIKSMHGYIVLYHYQANQRIRQISIPYCISLKAFDLLFGSVCFHPDPAYKWYMLYSLWHWAVALCPWLVKINLGKSLYILLAHICNLMPNQTSSQLGHCHRLYIMGFFQHNPQKH